MFQSNGLIEKFDLDVNKVKAFISHIASGYQDNSYHNALHAADVSQALNFLINSTRDTFQFTDVEMLGIVIAVMCHDYNHPGVNNNFLTATMDPLAVRYNFNSVLENMHASEAVSGLLRGNNVKTSSTSDTSLSTAATGGGEGNGCNFLSHLSREVFSDVCKVVTTIILATDMAKHIEITSQFSAKLAAGTFDPKQKADRMAGLLIMMKFSDISNTARPWKLCEFWAHRVMNEFFEQGDKEKERGLPVSPMMDRSTDIPKCQAAFSEFVVSPLCDLVGKIIPAEVYSKLSGNIKSNMSTWKSKLHSSISITSISTSPLPPSSSSSSSSTAILPSSTRTSHEKQRQLGSSNTTTRL